MDPHLSNILHCHFEVVHIPYVFLAFLFVNNVSQMKKKKNSLKESHRKKCSPKSDESHITGTANNLHTMNPIWVVLLVCVSLWRTQACTIYLFTMRDHYCNIYCGTWCSEALKCINFPTGFNWLFTIISALLDQDLDWHWKTFQLQEAAVSSCLSGAASSEWFWEFTL